MLKIIGQILLIALILASFQPCAAQAQTQTRHPRRAPERQSVPVRKPADNTQAESASQGNISGTVDPGKQLTKEEIDERVARALGSGSMTLNFDNTDIRTVTKIMADVTGKTIIVDGSVKGALTILSSRKLGIQEAWNLYVSAIEAAGYGIVAKNGAYKIVELSKSRKENATYAGTGSVKPREGFVTALVILSNADADIMRSTLAPLVPAPGIIGSYAPSNALVVTDTANNVSRITKIARQLDEKYKGSSIRIFQPNHIRVKDLATALTTVYQTTGGNNANNHQQIKIAAYEPTNTLIVLAPLKEFLQIEAVISQMDDESRISQSSERSFKVYYLKNADATEVAKSISMLLEEKKRIIQEVKKEQQGTEEAKNLDNLVSAKVAADTATNSLVFYVTEKEYKELLPMIGMLDAPQKQVLISAIIAETQLNNSLDAGIAWQVVSNPGILATFMGGQDETSLMQSLAGGNFIAGAIGSESVEINSGGSTLKIPKLYAVIKALETKGNFNLLSTPRVVTHDHKKAKLSATKTYPYATGTKYDTNNNPIISYEYKDIGLSIEVTPHVGQNNQVRLDLDLKLADLVEWMTQGSGASQTKVPVTSERNVNNIVTLNNGETIVIGGLIDEMTTETIRQVPILSKIPLIGGLFKDKSVSRTSRTLFVFLTPHIIDESKDLKDVTDKYGRALINEPPANGEGAPKTVQGSPAKGANAGAAPLGTNE